MSLEMSLLIVLYRIAGTIVFFITLYQFGQGAAGRGSYPGPHDLSRISRSEHPALVRVGVF